MPLPPTCAAHAAHTRRQHARAGGQCCAQARLASERAQARTAGPSSPLCSTIALSYETRVATLGTYAVMAPLLLAAMVMATAARVRWEGEGEAE